MQRLFELRTIFLLLLLLGCGEPRDSGRGEPFTDALGRTVAVERPAGRIVTLAPNLTEIVFAAGAGHKLVGVSTADDYPPAVDTLPRFSALPIDVEAVAALEPDLVLASDQVNPPQTAETLTDLGLPTVFLGSRSLAEVLASIGTVGTLLGTERQAARTVDSLRAALEALEAKTARIAERPRVLFLIGDETLFAYGRGSYVHDLIALAGGRSITADLPSAAPVLSEEYVLTERPDVIIGTFGEDYDPEHLLQRHPTWDVVPAVQEGRVYSLDPDLVNRPGPRLVEGARRMAALLHPDRF